METNYRVCWRGLGGTAARMVQEEFNGFSTSNDWSVETGGVGQGAQEGKQGNRGTGEKGKKEQGNKGTREKEKSLRK